MKTISGGWLPVTWGVGHVLAILLTWFPVVPARLAWTVLMGGCVVVSTLLASRSALPGWLATPRKRTSLLAILVVGGLMAVFSGVWAAEPGLLALQVAWILVGSLYLVVGLRYDQRTLLVTGPLWFLGVAATWVLPAAALLAFLLVALVCEVGAGLSLVWQQRGLERAASGV